MPNLALPALPIETHELDNGLRLVLHRDPSLPLVAINLWYHVGSRNERPGRTGLAHLFEHMLFQGSDHVGTNDHFRYVQQVGGVANGSTWFDRTNYFETLPSHHLELGLWLESDRLGWLLPALSTEKLDTQRQVVMNERRERVDNQPYGRAFERLHELLYPLPHPYHWPVIGYLEDIEAATMEDVRSFFSVYYSPGNAVLTIAGDFEPATARAAAEGYFGEIPTAAAARSAAVTPPSPTTETGGEIEIMPDRVALPRVYLGYRGPAYGRREWYALELLTTVLTGGRSSPMYHDLVYERQLAQDVGALLFPTEIAATFAIVATARVGTDPDELRERLLGHVHRIASAGCRPEDFERARNGTVMEHVYAFQRLERRADLISCCATFFDDPRRAAGELDRLMAVTRDDLQTVAARYLQATAATTVIVVPEGTAP